jgi:hypothetical protein
MDMEYWKTLLGKSQDDAAVKAALAAAGVKKVPLLDDDDTDVRFNLKGHGMWLLMTDEAYLKDLDDQDVGEGPLILSGVTANLDVSASRDLYKGAVPFKLAGGMTQVEVRKVLGKPSETNSESFFDAWKRDGFDLVASYTKDFKLAAIGVMLPGAE